MLVAYDAVPWVPFAWVLAVSVFWAAAAIIVMCRWTASSGWRDAHRFAAVCGAATACMLSGFAVFAVGGALRVDWIGKTVLNLIAAAFAISMWSRLRTDEAAGEIH